MKNAPRPMRRVAWPWPQETEGERDLRLSLLVAVLFAGLAILAYFFIPLPAGPSDEPIHFSPPGPPSIIARGDDDSGLIEELRFWMAQSEAFREQLEEKQLPMPAGDSSWIELIGQDVAIFHLAGGRVTVDHHTRSVEYSGEVPQGDVERRVWRAIAAGP